MIHSLKLIFLLSNALNLKHSIHTRTITSRRKTTTKRNEQRNTISSSRRRTENEYFLLLLLHSLSVFRLLFILSPVCCSLRFVVAVDSTDKRYGFHIQHPFMARGGKEIIIVVVIRMRSSGKFQRQENVYTPNQLQFFIVEEDQRRIGVTEQIMDYLTISQLRTFCTHPLETTLFLALPLTLETLQTH